MWTCIYLHEVEAGVVQTCVYLHKVGACVVQTRVYLHGVRVVQTCVCLHGVGVAQICVHMHALGEAHGSIQILVVIRHGRVSVYNQTRVSVLRSSSELARVYDDRFAWLYKGTTGHAVALDPGSVLPRVRAIPLNQGWGHSGC